MLSNQIDHIIDTPLVEQCTQWLQQQEGIDAGIINQAMATVAILQQIGMDDEGCVAALLQGAISIDHQCGRQIPIQFGATVAELYAGVQKLQQLSTFSRHAHNSTDAEENEEKLRKMLITMVDDVRVVLIKLADQLRLLRQARNDSRQQQQHLSQLTLDVFAPLANRLGMWQLKWEMEDFALRYRNPEVYQQLAGLLNEKRESREGYIQILLKTVRQSLATVGIEAEVHGRPKHLYSIWKKMYLKGLSFDNLWDIRAIRILVNSVADCYAALGIVHTSWRHLPGEFSDYIATPKANGYRSIHSVVIGPESKSVEVQIRTYQMHQDSEFGVAAHWRYKEHKKQEDSIDNKILWLRQLLEWKQEVTDANITAELIDAVGNQRVYVFTPKGTVMDLPLGATAIDFAYNIHSEVGHATRGARVNGKMVPLGYQLKTGDQVHIQTTKVGAPSRDWLRSDLGYVKTQRARSRIQHWFKLKDYDQNVAEGRSMLERELSRLGLEELSYEKIAVHTPFSKSDDLLASLGAGDYKLSRALHPFRRELERRSTPEIGVSKTQIQTTSTDFKVDGVGNLMTSMARCCQPVPGDLIVGFITTGRGVTIHHQQCNNILDLSDALQNRLIDVEWGVKDSVAYPVEILISAFHRSGILHDITQLLKDAKLNVLKVNMETDDENIVRVQLQLEVSGIKVLSKTLAQLSKIQNVLEVKRITN